jgi:hypothetical protein
VSGENEAANMEKKKLAESEEELTAGGEVIVYDEPTRRASQMVCPKCFSRNLEFARYMFDIDNNITKEGTFYLKKRNAMAFYCQDDDRFKMTCRDCGYTDYAKNFKNEIA